MRLIRKFIVGALGLLAFEAASRQLDWQDPTVRPDPYQGFPGTPPLYRLAPDSLSGPSAPALRQTSPNKLGNYRAASFPEAKPADEYRVFCLGGSSVRSDAFLTPDGSFPNMLEIYLRGVLAGRTPRVINAGGGGTGSVQNLEVLREVLGYQPDLIVVYPEGGEKNLIPPAPQGLMAVRDDASPLRVAARRELAQFHVYQAARDAYAALLPSRSEGAAISAFSALALSAIGRPFQPEHFSRPFEMKHDAPPVLMDFVIPRSEVQRAHQRFSRNLATMARLAREHAVPLLFVQPVRNLRASFYLRFHVDPSEIQPGRQAEWQSLWEQALTARRTGRLQEAIRHFLAVRALYIDDTDELLAFDLGETYLQIGLIEQAREEFARPYLRHPSRRLIAAAATENAVPLVDPWAYVAKASQSEHGVPGFEDFTDGFHPMPNTNRLIARAIVDKLGAAELLPPGARPYGVPERIAAEKAVLALIERCPDPPHNRMLAAMQRGDPDAAIAAARAIPEQTLLTQNMVESIYLGWALASKGDIPALRELHQKLRAIYWKQPAGLPPLETDADWVRNAFAGDVFAWF
ncbi:MAG: hypothetical protein ACT4PU_06640 [Planctomycetota bacterium]